MSQREIHWGTGDYEGLVWDGRSWRRPTPEEFENRPEQRDPIQAERMTTLDHLPGHRVTRVLGVVSGVGSMSGWTATSKGTTARERSFGSLSQAAFELDANAIIGISASVFGAGGGITSIVGGDAVGVLYIGTAVVVEPDLE